MDMWAENCNMWDSNLVLQFRPGQRRLNKGLYYTEESERSSRWGKKPSLDRVSLYDIPGDGAESYLSLSQSGGAGPCLPLSQQLFRLSPTVQLFSDGSTSHTETVNRVSLHRQHNGVSDKICFDLFLLYCSFIKWWAEQFYKKCDIQNYSWGA